MEFYNLFNKTQFRADQVINQLANPGAPVARQMVFRTSVKLPSTAVHVKFNTL
jgi:hypothetical protein